MRKLLRARRARAADTGRSGCAGLRGDRVRAARDGYGLLEVLIATALTSLIGAGLMTMLYKTQELTQDGGNALQAQQGVRMALDKIQRDLMNAGIGLHDLVAPFAAIEQRADGGIMIRWNGTGRVELLDQDVATGTRELPMADTTGFSPEQYVVVTDSAGNAQMLSVEEVQADRLLAYETSAFNFQVANGASVSSIVQSQYWVDSSSGTPTLWRQLDVQAPQPMAMPTQALSFVYLDDSTPSAPFTPTTIVERMRIRAVEVTLTVDAPNARVLDGTLPSYTLRARAVPRAILLTQ